MNRISVGATRCLFAQLAATAALAIGTMNPTWAQAQSSVAPTAELDAAALKKLGESNLAATQAGELAAAIGAISDATACEKVETSQRGMCIVMVKSYGMLAFVIGKQSDTVTQVIEHAPAQAQAAQAAPQEPKPWYESLFDWGKAATGKLFDVGLSLGTSYYQTKLGMRQSDNNAAVQTATVNGFVAMNNGTVRLGQTGFRTQYRTARDAFGMGTTIATRPQAPTYNIAGNNGSNITFGNQNNSQAGQEHRIASPGPCVNTQTNTQTQTAPQTTTPVSQSAPAQSAPPFNPQAAAPVTQPCTNGG